MSFDDLTAIYRIESKSASLAEVRKDLYSALCTLNDNIHREYEKQVSIDPGSIICEGTNERRKKIVLYSQKVIDQRMDKIVRLALSGAMGADNVIDHLTEEEKEYYHCILDSSKKHRSLVGKQKVRPKSVSLNVEPAAENAEPIIIEEPVISRPSEEQIETSMVEEDRMMLELSMIEEPPEDVLVAEDPVAVTERVDDAEPLAEPEEMSETVSEPHSEVADELPEEETMTIRVLEDLPPFSGPERDYDLKKEDVIRMPSVMANALISRQKAVRLIIP